MATSPLQPASQLSPKSLLLALRYNGSIAYWVQLFSRLMRVTFHEHCMEPRHVYVFGHEHDWIRMFGAFSIDSVFSRAGIKLHPTLDLYNKVCVHEPLTNHCNSSIDRSAGGAFRPWTSTDWSVSLISSPQVLNRAIPLGLDILGMNRVRGGMTVKPFRGKQNTLRMYNSFSILLKEGPILPSGRIHYSPSLGLPDHTWRK